MKESWSSARPASPSLRGTLSWMRPFTSRPGCPGLALLARRNRARSMFKNSHKPLLFFVYRSLAQVGVQRLVKPVRHRLVRRG